MPECRPDPRLARAALHPRKSPFPDLLGVPVFQDRLELPRLSVSLPPQSSPVTEEVGPSTRPAPPLDDRKRCRSLFSCGARRREPVLLPPKTSARPARWHGAQGSPPCCGWTEPRILWTFACRFPWLSPKQPPQLAVINSTLKSSTPDFARSRMRRTPS